MERIFAAIVLGAPFCFKSTFNKVFYYGGVDGFARHRAINAMYRWPRHAIEDRTRLGEIFPILEVVRGLSSRMSDAVYREVGIYVQNIDRVGDRESLLHDRFDFCHVRST